MDAFATWCEDNDIDPPYIDNGKPQQKGFAERFNGSMRRKFLDAYLFDRLSQVRGMAWVWRLDYNDERPHESLGNLPPSVYRQKLENSNVQLSHYRGSGQLPFQCGFPKLLANCLSELIEIRFQLELASRFVGRVQPISF